MLAERLAARVMHLRLYRRRRLGGGRRLGGLLGGLSGSLRHLLLAPRRRRFALLQLRLLGDHRYTARKVPAATAGWQRPAGRHVGEVVEEVHYTHAWVGIAEPARPSTKQEQ